MQIPCSQKDKSLTVAIFVSPSDSFFINTQFKKSLKWLTQLG